MNCEGKDCIKKMRRILEKKTEVKRGLEKEEEVREAKVLSGRGMEIVNPFLQICSVYE